MSFKSAQTMLQLCPNTILKWDVGDSQNKVRGNLKLNMSPLLEAKIVILSQFEGCRAH